MLGLLSRQHELLTNSETKRKFVPAVRNDQHVGRVYSQIQGMRRCDALLIRHSAYVICSREIKHHFDGGLEHEQEHEYEF